MLVIIISGCGTVGSFRDRNVSSIDLQESIREHHLKIRTMKSDGQIYIQSPDISQNGSFTLALKKPDSLLITIRGPFGIKIGSVLVTRLEFLFYNSLENKLISGSTNVENLEKILRIRLNFDDLLNLFGGGSFLRDDFHTAGDIQIEKNSYVLSYNTNNSIRRYWFDPDLMLIQKIQILDNKGKLIVEQEFINYEEIDGVMIPHLIRIIQPDQRRMLSVSYSYVRVNIKNNQFTFTVPQNAERIRW